MLLCHHDVHELIWDDWVCPVLAEDGTPEYGRCQCTATCDSAESIWEKLLSVYEQSSGQRLHRLMEQFLRSEKDGDDDVVTHIAKLQRNFSEQNDELKRVAKTTLWGLLVMNRIMSTLPSELFEFKNAWESLPIEERSVNKLTERLRLIEMRLPSKSDSTALVGTKKKASKKVERKCYVCRKTRSYCKILLEKGQETDDFW
ncbi:hypothetical protein AVEN_96181-1 [Araneus ventricosus]|uniref:Uncharacterized protein n=1 Tax=Araneus ventricosus TaxID=182803 RepID=A0A4Y2FSR8_ARAVE|nr:hypothetical protein AVEN_96181-1 [Araneus ventricosus]